MPTLFPMSELPEGFVYQPDFLTSSEEESLISSFHGLEFGAFDFHGYTARRRVVEYGLEYDFISRRATPTHEFPEFIRPLKDRAAEFAGLAAESLVEGIVTEYSPGAPIGWHRDAPQFGTVIGISLASACRMRFKPYQPKSRKSRSTVDAGPPEIKQRPLSIELQPRSIYIIRGAARWKYQHSIPPVRELRYSITFRTLQKEERTGSAA